MLACLIAIIVIFITLLVLNSSQNKYDAGIEDSSNTLRIFVLDIKNDKVTYFNSSSLQKRKSTNMTSFYNQFQALEKEKFINWINDLLDNSKEAARFLEVQVYIKKKRANVPSVLEIQKVNYEKQVIYMESRLLNFDGKSQKKGLRHQLVNKDLFVQQVLGFNGKGATFCVDFFNKNLKTNDFSKTAYVDLKNILASFINENVVITEHSFGQIIISNSESSTRLLQFEFIDNIKNKINKFLLIESFANEIDFTFGVIDNNVFFKDIANSIKNVIALAEIAKDDEQQTLFYIKKILQLRK